MARILPRPAGRGPALVGLIVGLVLAIGPAWVGLADVLAVGGAAPPATPPAAAGPPPGAAPVTTDPTAPARPAPTPGAPVRVRAPAIGLDAPVVSVGVRTDGQMEVPDRVADVGWYRFGPTPGASTGSAVLAGHVDDRVQGAGAFVDLGGLRPGDEVTVDAPGGAVVHRVREVRTYSKEALPVADLFRETGPSRLVLVTCDGPFDTDAGRYRDNLVVVADPG
ncbi:class F sortase [Actinomycetospora lutea]|uniref:class F sortase n=1 Tax=Actinomycetospora lutea TaxID=663604 RepID=UPI002366AE8C|nr:class F sortase [Actinomycetospora lutea]MDD7942386.1 class F sortase [Actinomycetospora lutea]